MMSPVFGLHVTLHRRFIYLSQCSPSRSKGFRMCDSRMLRPRLTAGALSHACRGTR